VFKKRVSIRDDDDDDEIFRGGQTSTKKKRIFWGSRLFVFSFVISSIHL
jgi:hypothetical protein